MIELATGISKATYATDAVMFNGDLFKKLYQEGRPGRYLYPRLKCCVQLVLHSSQEGYLLNSIAEVLGALELPSVIEILPAAEKGAFINRTRDLLTAAGTVLMVHESGEQIQADIAKIREAEEAGELYAVAAMRMGGSPPCPPARCRASSMEHLELEPQRTRLNSFEKVDELWSEMNVA